MIKGGGAALTREKIVAAQSSRFVCIADESKLVDVLGRFPVPVEVIPMATQRLLRQFAAMGGTARVRLKDGLPLESSYHHYLFAKMADYPKDVQIIIMPNSTGAAAAGMGEVAMSAPSGAIANAYARATGIKPRNFPLNAQPGFTPVPPGQLPPPAVAA